MIQPNITFTAEQNYYKSFRHPFDPAFESADYSDLTVRIDNAFDVTEALREAIAYQVKNSYQGYIPD